MAAASNGAVAPAPAPPVDVVFEFWDDSRYSMYRPAEQTVLLSKFWEVPRPSTVELAGGLYQVHNFDGVENGLAVQVKPTTRFERAVRLRPPYRLPGAPAMSWGTPAGGNVEFEWKDKRDWKKYSPKVQSELSKVLDCAPLPRQVLFGEGGQAYWLMGLDTLLTGSPQMTQVNARTQWRRAVRVVGPGAGAAPPPQPPLHAMQASGGSRATSSNGPGRMARFRLADGRELDPAAEAVLLDAWRAEPRPGSVTLPSGHEVSSFHDLEVDGAFVTDMSQGAPRRVKLLLLLERPPPGKITLPDGLEGEGDFCLDHFGRELSAAEVLQLSLQGAGSDNCSICMCPMGSSAAPNSSASNAVPQPLDEQVFELNCKHVYHRGCLEEWFKTKRRCPACGKQFGKVFGNQPRVGTFTWHYETGPLPGFAPDTDTMVISFDFPAGINDEGKPYDKRQPYAYLPGNTQGYVLLEVFKIAFRRRCMFGLGDSLTHGTFRPTYNVHIKTSRKPRGAAGHGFPDRDYFRRCLDTLKENGIAIADLPR